MRKKLSRNDPCWCGSGNKYKKCHLGRELKPRPSREEANKILKKSFNKSFCMHPDSPKGHCKGNIVRAHTIQRNGGLSRISRKNHVYRFYPEYNNASKELVFAINLIGIKKASTFTGFCNYHDTKTFKRIEKHTFSVRKDQIFLLAYRALCKEVFLKNNQLIQYESLKDFDRGLDPINQYQFQEFHKWMSYGVSLGARTINRQKAIYDNVLLSGDYSTLNYFVILIDKTPEFLCSGTSILEIDFNGKRYNQLGNADIDQEIITLSIIPIDTGGAIVFATLDNGSVSKDFIDSLKSLPKDKLSNAMLRYTIEFFENVYLSPEWWDNLSEKNKKGLLSRASSGIRPAEERSSGSLLDDGYKYLEWNIEAIHYKQ